MKMFQYITYDNKGLLEEIWACENCRMKNSIQILKGKWRLIDKRENVNYECDNCRAMRREAEQQIVSDNRQEGKTPFL
jgi:hypothetical protein